MIEELLRDSKAFYILLLSAILLILIDNTAILNLPKSLIQQVTSPIQYGFYRTSINVGKEFGFVFVVRQTVQENKALKQQLSQILSENAVLEKQLSETKALLTQQSALNAQTFTLLSAHPIGIARYLYVDRGADDGVKVGQVVVFKDSFLGRVSSTAPKKSQIMLLTDPDSHVAAFAGNGDKRAKGVLSGQFESEMLMDKVLHEEQVNPGDLVYSEGSELEVPRGLVMGQVSEVLNRDNEVFKQAKVKAVFDISTLDLVFVVTN
jgi:rod shape-determining protein MreC